MEEGDRGQARHPPQPTIGMTNDDLLLKIARNRSLSEVANQTGGSRQQRRQMERMVARSQALVAMPDERRKVRRRLAKRLDVSLPRIPKGSREGVDIGAVGRYDDETAR